MWVLVAVTVGGDTMGVAGMLIMIPLASVIFTLMREFTDFRLKHLEIDEAKLVEQAPELKSGFKQQRERSKAKFDLWKAAKALKKKK
jgi:hypothetical protein